MHADVGGGYPDESLSYVSLLWMMEEAEHAGLRTLTVIKDRFVALASSFGPLHDSRAGLGAYYRYQPRKIAAWLDPVDSRTLSLRDPAINDDRGRSRGLLRSVKVHESVINRIATGTDRYAPITLPEDVRASSRRRWQGETAPQADSETPADAARTGHAETDGRPDVRARMVDEPRRPARVPAAIEADLEPRVVAADHLFRDARRPRCCSCALPLLRWPTADAASSDRRPHVDWRRDPAADRRPAGVRRRVGRRLCGQSVLLSVVLAGVILAVPQPSGRGWSDAARRRDGGCGGTALEDEASEPAVAGPDVQEQPRAISASSKGSSGTSCRTGLSRR